MYSKLNNDKHQSQVTGSNQIYLQNDPRSDYESANERAAKNNNLRQQISLNTVRFYLYLYLKT
jgi:hypothetical protein